MNSSVYGRSINGRFWVHPALAHEMGGTLLRRATRQRTQKQSRGLSVHWLAARCNEPDSARTTNVRISSSMTNSYLLVEQYDIAKIAFDASANQPYAFVQSI